jgi:hypothetical protein
MLPIILAGGISMILELPGFTCKHFWREMVGALGALYETKVHNTRSFGYTEIIQI